MMCFYFQSELDLQQMGSIEELEQLGLDSLKSTLISLGLKCGGTLTQRAQRLWAVRGLPKQDWNPALLTKPIKAKNSH